MAADEAEHHHHHAHGPANRGRRVLETAAPLFVRFPRERAETAVVVLHDIYGLTEPIERCCRMLAELGHLTVAPYVYYAHGGREFKRERPIVARSAWFALPADELEADVAGALDYLTRRHDISAADTAILGIGTGGVLASQIAAHPGLGAVVVAERLREPQQEKAMRQLAAEVDRELRAARCQPPAAPAAD